MKLVKGCGTTEAEESHVLVGLVGLEQDTGVCSSCPLVLVAADGNGWSLQVCRQVMDSAVWRAEACGWNDSL